MDVDDRSQQKQKLRNNKEIDFLNDALHEMTWGRRIALYMAAHFAWYNPYLNKKNNSNKTTNEGSKSDTTTTTNPPPQPSLDKAWAFFEHVTLERYVVDDDNRQRQDRTTVLANMTMWERIVNTVHHGDQKLSIAEPGEKELPTRLYNPLTTPLKQLGDFGLGYGLYFSTLRSFAVLCLVAGLLNLPNLLYFASEDYNGPTDQDDAVSFSLKGSAICTDVSWVPCPDCPRDYKYQKLTFSKWSHATGLHVAAVDGGEWVNVSSYVNFVGIDHAVREEIMYSYVDEDTDQLGGSVFQANTLAAFERDLNVKISATQIILPDGTQQDCQNRKGVVEANKCIEEYCWCQIQSFQDCYCRFGSNLPNANFEVSTMGFAEKTNCDGATLRNGFINMATVFLFIIGTMFIQHRQNQLIVHFDGDEQTAQDYSICILNPPKNAHNPKEWKSFFEGNFDCKVTVCTVDVENDNLVQLLVKRRQILHSLEILFPGVVLTNREISRIAARDKKDVGSNAHKLIKKLRKVEVEVKVVLREKRDHPVTSVFVTFETEKGQREVLSALSVGSDAARKNDRSSLGNPRHLFRGRHVLEVSEPEEPSAIRWQEFSTTPLRMIGGLVLTSFLCLVLVVIAFTAILIAYRSSPGIAPIITTVFTSIFPMFAKALMSLERHPSETSRQTWLFIKIASFNILIAAVLLSVVNPFTATIDPTIESLPGLIPSVHTLFFSQLGLSPILQLLDISGNLNRHVFAPRAKTQEEMNRQFGGTEMFLAERYANMIKFLFLIVWYCAIYPAAFFMGFVALLITYFADRFSLMRSWSRTPQVGRQISDFARNYLTPAALALMAVLSAYAWSGFPYDDLCEYEVELNPSVYDITWSLRERGTRANLFGYDLFKAPDVQEEITIPRTTTVYKFCLQDFRAYSDDPSFPPLPRFQLEDWMTEDQEQLLNIYSWVAVGIFGCVMVSFVIRNGTNFWKHLKGGYTPHGDDMGIRYSEIKSVDSYLPSCPASLRYPLLLFDVSRVDTFLFSWTDPDRPHTHYDITRDVRKLIREDEIKATHLFAQVRHWPPTPGKSG